MATLPEFPSGWHCYLLLCNDASYYCGITSSLTNRIRDHASRKGSGYTKENKPVSLVWYESHKNRRSTAPGSPEEIEMAQQFRDENVLSSLDK